MPLFGPAPPDPKDEVIAVLRDERDYLRAKVTDLERQLLALHSTHAFRLLNPDEKLDTPAIPAPEDAYTKKHTDFTPDFSLAQVESRFLTPADPFSPPLPPRN